MFKLQHPQDLISRLFILEYVRDIGAVALHEKANKHQRDAMFYTFMDDEENEKVDMNWEALMFECTIHQLEGILKHFMPEIGMIDEARTLELQKMAMEIVEEEKIAPVDMNIMDMAQTEMRKFEEPGIVLPDGFKPV